jgi:putative oxidoreductase
MDLWASLTSGLSRWQWIGALLARLAVGVLFAISGGGKLFVPARRQEMRETLRQAGLPAPELSAAAVSSIELVFGVFLAIGFLTPVDCVMLGCTMVGALTTTVLPGIEAKSFLGWVGELLYLPEVLYLVLLAWLFLAGPGWLSVDHLVLSSLGR